MWQQPSKYSTLTIFQGGGGGMSISHSHCRHRCRTISIYTRASKRERVCECVMCVCSYCLCTLIVTITASLPIMLLAKSTRLPWRRFSFLRITFISPFPLWLSLLIKKETVWVYLSAFKCSSMPISTNHSHLFRLLHISNTIYWHRWIEGSGRERHRSKEYEAGKRIHADSHTIFSINGLKNVLIRIKSIKIYKYGESYVFSHFSLTLIPSRSHATKYCQRARKNATE